MKKIIDLVADELAEAFEKAGYERSYAKVTLSNRPDLCEYQCNGAMAGAKAYKKAPIMIAEAVAENLKDSRCIEEVNAVKPGFINMKLRNDYVAGFLNDMGADDELGVEKAKEPKIDVYKRQVYTMYALRRKGADMLVNSLKVDRK